MHDDIDIRLEGCAPTSSSHDGAETHQDLPWHLDRFYDRRGQSISFSEWEKLRGDSVYILLADWRGEGDAAVLTLWTGVDIDYRHKPRAAIFETHCVFGTHHFYRYSTESAALRGHESCVWFMSRGIQPWDDAAVAAAGGRRPS